MSILGDAICPSHGWMAHAFVHEAAHAVAAVDRQIRFTRVDVLSPLDWKAHPSGEMLGGVRMLSDRPGDWVLPQPVEALEFVLAGALAEERFFGHALPGGQDGDLRVWRIGYSATDVSDFSELEGRLGTSIRPIVERLRVSTFENSDRIVRVASALAGVPDIRTVTSLGFSSDWTLTEAQIIKLID